MLDWARNYLPLTAMAGVIIIVFFADVLPLPMDSYSFQRFLLVVVLGVCVSLGLAILVHRHGACVIRLIWPAVLVAVSFVLLATYRPGSLYSWVEPMMFGFYFLGFVVIGCLADDELMRKRWIDVFVIIAVICAAFYSLVSLMLYSTLLVDNMSSFSSFLPWGFANIRYWSHIATWLLPLFSLALTMKPLNNQFLWRCIVVVTSALWWWLVFMSASRGTILGITFGAVFVIPFFGRLAVTWLKGMVGLLVAGGLAWLVLSVILPAMFLDDLTFRAIRADTSGRWPLFVEAWEMSLQHFPFGMGAQSWLTHEILTETYRVSGRLAHPHNMYLFWAAEYGWLLLISVLIMGAVAWKSLWFRRSELHVVNQANSGEVLVAFTASVVGSLLHGGVSAVFMAPGSMLIGFFVLGIFWALVRERHGRSVASVNLWVPIATGFAFLAITIFWLYLVMAYYDAMLEDRSYYESQVPEIMLPRFWFHGYFPRHPSMMP